MTERDKIFLQEKIIQNILFRVNMYQLVEGTFYN